MPTSSGAISPDSGPLNVAELVAKLIEVERRSSTLPLARKAEGIRAMIVAYGRLAVALADYQAALEADKLLVDLARDVSALTIAAHTFAASYNTLATAVAELTRVTPVSVPGEKGASAPLASDASVRNMMAQLRGTLMAPVDAGHGLNHLARIGISPQKDGILEIDSARFGNVAARNFYALSHLLGAKRGVIARLQAIMDQMLSSEGMVARRKEVLQISLAITEVRVEDANRHLAEMRDRITNKFNRVNAGLARAELRAASMHRQFERQAGKR